MKRTRGMIATPLLWLIRGYQVAVSPWLGPRCRYQPTCSQYAATAIDRFGARRGLPMAVRRMLRCHPWGGHGYDPVPDDAAGGARPAKPADAERRARP